MQLRLRRRLPSSARRPALDGRDGVGVQHGVDADDGRSVIAGDHRHDEHGVGDALPGRDELTVTVRAWYPGALLTCSTLDQISACALTGSSKPFKASARGGANGRLGRGARARRSDTRIWPGSAAPHQAGRPVHRVAEIVAADGQHLAVIEPGPHEQMSLRRPADGSTRSTATWASRVRARNPPT